MLYIIYERFNNPASLWKPYFDVLPTVFPTALNYGYEQLIFVLLYKYFKILSQRGGVKIWDTNLHKQGI